MDNALVHYTPYSQLTHPYQGCMDNALVHYTPYSPGRGGLTITYDFQHKLVLDLYCDNGSETRAGNR